MKTVLIALLVLVAEVSFAEGLTNGSFEGTGLWKASSGRVKGEYKTTTVIKGNKVEASYNMGPAGQYGWKFEMKETAPGFFDVMSRGEKVGAGYCLEKVVVCHYDVSAPNLKLEETITIQGATLYRFGSKNQGRGTIAWQEKLNHVNIK